MSSDTASTAERLVTPPARAREHQRVDRSGGGPSRSEADRPLADEAPVVGLTAIVAHVLGLLQDRRWGHVDSGLTHDLIARLRYLTHDEPDPSVRARVRVACAHLGAGDLEETRLALSDALMVLGRPATKRRS